MRPAVCGVVVLEWGDEREGWAGESARAWEGKYVEKARFPRKGLHAHVAPHAHVASVHATARPPWSPQQQRERLPHPPAAANADMASSPPPASPPPGLPLNEFLLAFAQSTVNDNLFTIIVSLIAVAFGFLIVACNQCMNRNLSGATKMSWWHVLDFTFGIMDFGFKCVFFMEVVSTGNRLRYVCIVVYFLQVTFNMIVELNLFRHLRNQQNKVHIGKQNLDFDMMQKQPTFWFVIILLSCFSPSLLVVWPWRKRAYNGYPRMREAGISMALVLFDDVPQIILIVLAASTVDDGGGAGCDAVAVASGLSTTQFWSLLFAGLSLIIRGLYRIVHTFLGQDRTSGHMLEARQMWSFELPAAYLLKDSADCNLLIPLMRTALMRTALTDPHAPCEHEMTSPCEYKMTHSGGDDDALEVIRRRAQLANLAERLELQLEGKQSPSFLVTLPEKDKKRVNIPADAKYYTFMYPCTPKASTDAKASTDDADETAAGRAEKVDAFLNLPIKRAKSLSREDRNVLAGIYDALQEADLRALADEASGGEPADLRALADRLPVGRLKEALTEHAMQPDQPSTWDRRCMRKLHRMFDLHKKTSTPNLTLCEILAEEFDVKPQLVQVWFRDRASERGAVKDEKPSESLTPQQYKWGCFMLLGGFGYYDKDGKLLRINAFSGGNGGVTSVPLDLEGPFEANEEAAEELWGSDVDGAVGTRMNKVSLPALLLERAEHFAWVGDKLLAGKELSTEEGWEHGAFVYHGGDRTRLRDKGLRHIFFRVAPTLSWGGWIYSSLSGGLKSVHQVFWKKGSSQSRDTKSKLTDEPACAPEGGSNSSGEADSQVDGGARARSGEVARSRAESDGASMPAVRGSGETAHLGSDSIMAVDAHGPHEEHDFWFFDDPHKKWRRCDESSNRAYRHMLDPFNSNGAVEKSCTWSSSGWAYRAFIKSDENGLLTLVQVNVESKQERKIWLRFESAADGTGRANPCGDEEDARLTRCVLEGTGIGDMKPYGLARRQAHQRELEAAVLQRRQTMVGSGSSRDEPTTPTTPTMPTIPMVPLARPWQRAKSKMRQVLIISRTSVSIGTTRTSGAHSSSVGEMEEGRLSNGDVGVVSAARASMGGNDAAMQPSPASEPTAESTPAPGMGVLLQGIELAEPPDTLQPGGASPPPQTPASARQTSNQVEVQEDRRQAQLDSATKDRPGRESRRSMNMDTARRTVPLGLPADARSPALPPPSFMRQHYNMYDSTGTMLRVDGTADPNFTGYTVPNNKMVKVVREHGVFSEVIVPPGKPAMCGWVRTKYLFP